MNALTSDRINRLINRRERLTNRRDGRINIPAVNEIDERLRNVPAGERPDVDALLGRYASIAEALEREGARLALRPQTDTAAATAHVAELADEITENMRDWRDIKGDLAL